MTVTDAEASPAARFKHGPDRRVRRRVDFLRIQSVGERASTRHFVLLVARREAEGATAKTPPPSRLGVVVTKKVGNAVQRSRVKRLCREAFRTWPDLVPDGIDLVVIARTGAHELDLAKVRAEWKGAHRTLSERCRVALSRETPGERRPKASSSARTKAPK